jgi:Tol biopolymer transport system component
MKPDRQSQISDLYNAAQKRTPEERSEFLKQACDGDETLRQEVESLLRYESAAAAFLEAGAVQMIAGVVASGTPAVNRQLGPYTIVSPLGVGGMGEVYRARDSKLGRDVAIKILPSHFAADPERRARLAREARLLATLNHPHIGAIYGLEESDGVTALVLELVEGPTLADRLARGLLPIAEALTIGRQVAEALDAAHEKGIVHRDLKPANIVLQSAANAAGVPSGETRAKVLDFGLAKTMAVGLEGDLTQRPPGLLDGTEEGRILGTPAYMSPEQARGEAVDKRTDIWAFGCVLYEMLSGRRPFDGDTITDTAARILERDPDWSVLPDSTPVPIRTLIERCLRKDPRKRLHDIADALIEIEDRPAAADRAVALHAPVAPRVNRERFAWIVAAALGVTLVGMALLPLRDGGASPGDRVDLMIDPPGPGQRFSWISPRFAISPDGSHIAFAVFSQGESMLWVRSLDTLELRMLPGTEGASLPFWRPDSQAIGFFANNSLKTVGLGGGAPVLVCKGQGSATWNQDDVIVFESAPTLRRVSARGGTPEAITSVTGSGRAPRFLPDGKHFLYFVNREGSNELRVGSLTPTESSVSLGPFESHAEYAAEYLFFVRGGSLVAQPFDQYGRELVGSPRYVAAGAAVDGVHGMFSVSATGRLAYSTAVRTSDRLTWLDRQGRRLSSIGDPGISYRVALSPDELRIALSRKTPGQKPQVNLWLIDLARSGLTTRLTYDPGIDTDPAWSPEGDRFVFTSSTPSSLFVRAPYPDSWESPLLKSGKSILMPDWSRDGHFIVYTELVEFLDSDLWVVPLTGNRTPTLFLKTKYAERAGVFSPDGRWIAFESDASGHDEVYVRPFPVQPGQLSISRAGGRSPRWRGDGQEIFFLSLDGLMMAASVDPSNGFVGVPQPLFRPDVAPYNRSFAVSDNGQRFLIPILEPPEPITVLMNWRARLAK